MFSAINGCIIYNCSHYNFYWPFQNPDLYIYKASGISYVQILLLAICTYIATSI